MIEKQLGCVVYKTKQKYLIIYIDRRNIANISYTRNLNFKIACT